VRVAILGQGYVGLPVAVRAAEVGHDVIGFEVDPGRVALLQAGTSFVEDISDQRLGAAIATGRYTATNVAEDLRGFDVAVIAVPTPLAEGGTPDLSYVRSAGELLAPSVSVGCTVILESTTYPGTTEEILIPILEAGSSLRAGTDFHVGYSPERIDPGNRFYHFENTPKVVAGLDAESLTAVDNFYSSIVEKTVPVSGLKEAELAKLLENTFRHVNIALINEMAIFAHDLGVDIWQVIDAADSKPFGFMRFTPGPGVGGHCLPIDPSYLSWEVRRSLGHSFRFIELANDINEHMPDYVVRRLVQRLNREQKSISGTNFLLLGLAYKKNSSDPRESPAIQVAKRLVALGGIVHAADPFTIDRYTPQGVTKVDLNASELAAADCVVLLTDHDDFDYDLLLDHTHKVFDTRRRIRFPGVEFL
jgi:UDP-N-acetyl-D-glucosamine dehydrogenase